MCAGFGCKTSELAHRGILTTLHGLKDLGASGPLRPRNGELPHRARPRQLAQPNRDLLTTKGVAGPRVASAWIGGLTVSVVAWLVVIVVVVVLVVLVGVFLRRRGRGGGVIATRRKR